MIVRREMERTREATEELARRERTMEEERDVWFLVGKKFSKHSRYKEKMIIVNPDLSSHV